MSQADVDLLRDNMATLAEEGFEALLPLVHPDFEMETLPGIAAEPQVYKGREGMRRWWESFYEVMDEVRVEPVEIHDGGPGRAIMEANLVAKGHSSGLEVSQPAWMLCHTRDQLLVKIEFFTSLEEALAARPD